MKTEARDRAFACPEGAYNSHQRGLSKIEYFAAAALPTIMEIYREMPIDAVAAMAFQMGEAMNKQAKMREV